MRSLYLIISILCIAAYSFGQTILPKGFAPGESKLMQEYIQHITTQQRSTTDAPEGPVRTMAEWEELDAIVVAWTSFPEILTEIIRAAREEVNVIVVCRNQAQAENYLLNAGVDLSSNVTFVVEDYDSIWIRDYGPNSAYINDVDSLIFIDWIYNRPRFKDNAIPAILGETLDIPVYSTTEAPNDLVNTGGNFMADGLGNGYSSELVIEENGAFNQWGISNHSEADVDRIMGDYMGLEEYRKMEVLPWDLIHHIDMHMKLLDERTLLVGEYPEGIADGPQIEANIQYLINQFETVFGTEFRVVRIPMPPDEFGRYPSNNGDYRTYTNSLLVNNTILIPTYQEQYDTTAMRIWGELMPGYKLVGIDCNDIIPLSGAIHCITKEIGTQDPLQIAHARHHDVEADANSDYSLSALIKHTSGIQEASIFYRIVGEADYDEVAMQQDSGDSDFWNTIIPQQPAGTVIEYYIDATANSGKTQTRPLAAPEGYFDFTILHGEELSSTLESDELIFEEVYPNPAKAITAIPLHSKSQQSVSIQLRDNTGKLVEVVYQGRIKSGDNMFFLDARQYSPGLYFVHVQGENVQLVQEIIIEQY